MRKSIGLLAVLVILQGCAVGVSSEVRQHMQSLYGENRTISSIPDGAPKAECDNGTFIGKYKDGLSVYKGIPYAIPPTGERRWKAPQAAPAGNVVREAYFFGPSPIQTEAASEHASCYPQSEDCLYLNVWTDERSSEKDKAVMVFIHGGSYGWGGTSDPLYEGFNLVKAHPDVVLVTIGYRTGIMGFLDLSGVPGGEEYKDAPNLGLLDQLEALRWVQRNIRAFGGDPSNVTVFGESAGGGSVSLIPLMKESKGLMRRTIAQSGSIALTFSKDECRGLTEKLLKASKARSMEDLLHLSEEELKKLNEDLNDFNCFPQRDGRLLPEDLYAAYRRSENIDVDMLIGTNKDEARYWIGEMGGTLIYKLLMPRMYRRDMRRLSDEDKALVEQFNDGLPSGSWEQTEFYNEVMFRIPAIRQAEERAAVGHPAYMYYWTKPSTLPNRGACHAVELAYVFGNLDETIYTGERADAALSAEVQQMWVNFAKTGNPGTAEHIWPAYTAQDRITMELGDEIRLLSDPLPEGRQSLTPLMKYHFNGSYADLLP